MKMDLTVAAIPAYLAAMGAEFWWQRRHAVEPDTVQMGRRAGDYEFADTMASLTMGVGSLIAPYLSARVLQPITPTRGRYGKALIIVAVTSSALVTLGDVLARRIRGGELPAAQTVPAEPGLGTAQDGMNRLRRGLAVTAVASTALTAATVWSAQTVGSALFTRTRLDLGASKLALLVAVFGWDFIYYFNHRLSHESRWLWAIHVVHHSSQRYNLSTALRQPVVEGVTMTVPYGLLALLGVRPSLIEQARQVNLIYQFWIHTETIGRLGWVEQVFNTPSHHRVHHGSNSAYLDRNHGSILIIWDRLFGTFEEEVARPVYGLTSNINSFNPFRIATHELGDIAKDIYHANSWRDRWSYLLRGPGWAACRRLNRDSPASAVGGARLA